MDSMKLTAASWSFVGASLKESADIWKALGLKAMDLIAFPDGMPDAKAIDRDPDGQATLLGDLGIDLASVLYFFGSWFDDNPVNSSDSNVRIRNMDIFERVLAFCNKASIPTVCVLPGVDQKGISHEEAVKIAGETMSQMAGHARQSGVRFVFEPHIESVLESPIETLTFLNQYSDLEIALDYAHFIAQGYDTSDVDPLVPFAGQIHLRQGAKTQLQARWDEGQIDFPKVIGMLKDTGFTGTVMLEYEHEDWKDCNKVDVMTESIKMRDAVTPYL